MIIVTPLAIVYKKKDSSVEVVPLHATYCVAVHNI